MDPEHTRTMPADEHAVLLQADRRKVHQGRQAVPYQKKRSDPSGEKSRDQHIDRRMSGNFISVKTLDLNCSFESIADQLDKIAEAYL